MSFWKYLFDSDHLQRADIESLKSRSRRQLHLSRSNARRNRSKITDLNERIEELEDEVGGLQLMNRALLTYLRRQDDWDDDAFRSLVYELDMEDGKLDGK